MRVVVSHKEPEAHYERTRQRATILTVAVATVVISLRLANSFLRPVLVIFSFEFNGEILPKGSLRDSLRSE